MRPRAFTLAELLVVLGVIALLLAILVPPLQLARKQAQATTCGVHIQQIGLAAQQAQTEFGFFPLWDDRAAPERYTWIDVLIEREFLAISGNVISTGGRKRIRVGYCPSDEMPDDLNAARHTSLRYPLDPSRAGMDYSYGIGVPLSAGGWAWRASPFEETPLSRRFRDHETRTSSRVLAADAFSSRVYNLSGDALGSDVWSDPTQFDNTVAWSRHRLPGRGLANLLFQDGHVERARFQPEGAPQVNTARVFLWQPGESVYANPEDAIGADWYPSEPPPNYQSAPPGDVFPNEMVPYWYTANRRWTRIPHK
jgi:prepilin-type N-terminal cleavage/methylation domain-containing protein/prepilin-type processing-associated H-X9-DG protein